MNMSMYVEYWMRQMLYYITYPTLEILFRYVFYHKYISFFLHGHMVDGTLYVNVNEETVYALMKAFIS